ncbi:MAG: UvrD-helicase domain-containing protein [Pseudonocardiaceae bacterium]
MEVGGAIWENATEIWAFTGPVGAWWRIFSRRQAGEVYYTYPASQVRIVMSAAQAPAAAEVLRYWRDIVSRLPDDDPLQPQPAHSGRSGPHPLRLGHRGPPGTGKTETILNLIANIITAEAGTVGVVSFTNAAVNNVRDKLDELGFGHVIASLG